MSDAFFVRASLLGRARTWLDQTPLGGYLRDDDTD